MTELYNDWLVSKMTRAELDELSPDEKKERGRLQHKISAKKYREENIEKIKETQRKYSRKYYNENTEHYRQYREEHKEEILEYNRKYYQTAAGKKSKTISSWVNDLGLQESDEDLDRIYDLWLHQEICNACDIKLTRTGKCISTDATMDHDHETGRFRHIICLACNNKDSWKKYFC